MHVHKCIPPVIFHKWLFCLYGTIVLCLLASAEPEKRGGTSVLPKHFQSLSASRLGALQPWPWSSPEAKGLLVSLVAEDKTCNRCLRWSKFWVPTIWADTSPGTFAAQMQSFFSSHLLLEAFISMSWCELPGRFPLSWKNTFCKFRKSCVCLISLYLDGSGWVVVPCSLYACRSDTEYSHLLFSPSQTKTSNTVTKKICAMQDSVWCLVLVLRYSPV